jgi:protein-S-isoprenylcysteine O-methyltransferase Ste14
MQPPFISQPVQLVALVATLLVWRVVETVLDIRTARRLRSGAQRQDRGSRLAVLCAVVIGLLLGILVANQAPATTIAAGRAVAFWLGILLMYIGIAVRLYAVITLGAYFTTEVATVHEQQVVSRGPYRYIRHPSYTGFLLILLGFGLCFANWLSPLLMVGIALIGFGYRIHVEERLLQEQLGQPYQTYMGRTKRLVPFVL